MKKLFEIIVFLIMPIIVFIIFILHTIKLFFIKYIIETFFLESKNENKKIHIQDNLLTWHGEDINIKDIKFVVYGRLSRDKYLFWYILKNENSYYLSSSSSGGKLYSKRKHKENKENAILLRKLFEKKFLSVLPSMWLHLPIGLMGCTITGGFKNSNFVTLAGDSKQIYIYQGLDCNPSNIYMELTDIKSFNLKNDVFIKTMPTMQLKTNLYMSEYQIYVLNKEVTLGKGYMFFPWSNGEFLFEEIVYFNYIEDINIKIVNYFLQNNNKISLSDKNCIVRNNP